MKDRILFQYTAKGQHTVSIIQSGLDRARIVYGAEISDRMQVHEAFNQVGSYIHHAVECTGIIEET